LTAVGGRRYILFVRGATRSNPKPKGSRPRPKTRPAEKDEGSTIGWGLRKLDIPEIWKETKGENIRIAVLDTGIYLDHPDLSGAVEDAYNFVDDNEDVTDSGGHGTRCAGIIAGRGKNEVTGVAPSSRLLIGKIMRHPSSGLNEEFLIQGITWAIDREADIISISSGKKELGTGYLKKIEEVFEGAINRNVCIAAAIGNRGDEGDDAGNYPARLGTCISVGALDENLELWAKTDRYANLTLCAPGVNIKTTTVPPADSESALYLSVSGTSYACPFLAGVVALLLSKGSGKRTVADMKKVLTDTAEPKTDGDFPYLVLNARAAFERF
jgi:subtilisin family serine protease